MEGVFSELSPGCREAPSDGFSSGCVDVGRALAKEILKNPADYYVNVHNAEFPGGALRGQLSK